VTAHRDRPFRELLARVAAGAQLTAQDRAELQRDELTASTLDALRRLGWNGDDALPERIRLFHRLVGFCPARSLPVDGRLVKARVSPEELWRFYLPLCQALRRRASEAGAARTLVGVTGTPGSGKSTFCALLQALLHALCGEEGGVLTFSQDAFHHPNACLAARGLRALKGVPETFDARAFVRALDRLRVEPSLCLPAYDRTLHDPVPDVVRVRPDHRLALVEGNYLLLNAGAWAGVRRRLALVLYLAMPLDAIRPFIVRRHMRGGRTRADAVEHFERVDEPDYRLCAETAQRADLIVERSARQRIRSIRARA